jgi:hypothetical protein
VGVQGHDQVTNFKARHSSAKQKKIHTMIITITTLISSRKKLEFPKECPKLEFGNRKEQNE